MFTKNRSSAVTRLRFRVATLARAWDRSCDEPAFWRTWLHLQPHVLFVAKQQVNALRAELTLIARLWPRVSAAHCMDFGRPTLDRNQRRKFTTQKPGFWKKPGF